MKKLNNYIGYAKERNKQNYYGMSYADFLKDLDSIRMRGDQNKSLSLEESNSLKEMDIWVAIDPVSIPEHEVFLTGSLTKINLTIGISTHEIKKA